MKLIKALLVVGAVCLSVPFADDAFAREKAGYSEAYELFMETYSINSDAAHEFRDFIREEHLQKAYSLLESHRFDQDEFNFKTSFRYAMQSGHAGLLKAFLDHGVNTDLLDANLKELGFDYKYYILYGQESDVGFQPMGKRARQSLKFLVKHLPDATMSKARADLFRYAYDKADPEIVKPLLQLPLPQEDTEAAFRLYAKKVFDQQDPDGNHLELMGAVLSGTRPPGLSVVRTVYFKALDSEVSGEVLAHLLPAIDQSGFAGGQAKTFIRIMKNDGLRSVFAKTGLLFTEPEEGQGLFAAIADEYLPESPSEAVRALSFLIRHYESSGSKNEIDDIFRLLITNQLDIVEQLLNVNWALDAISQKLLAGIVLLPELDGVKKKSEEAVINKILSKDLQLNFRTVFARIDSRHGSGIIKQVMRQMTKEDLLFHQKKLLELVEDQSIRNYLAGRGFRFKGPLVWEEPEQTALSMALSRFSDNPSKSSLDYLFSILELYEPDASSDADYSLITQAMNLYPQVFQMFARGFNGYEAYQKYASERLYKLLSQFDYTEVARLLTTYKNNRPVMNISFVPEPESGLESLACSLVNTFEHPVWEDPDNTYRLTFEWITSQNAAVNVQNFLECAQKNDKLNNLPLKQLGFSMALLNYADWNPAETGLSVFMKIKEQILDEVVDILHSTNEAGVWHIAGLFAGLAEIDRKWEPFVMAKDDLIVASYMSANTFNGVSRPEIMESFVDHLLGIYPLSLYNHFLTQIYASGNNKLFAYVLSNARHRAYMQKNFDLIFGEYGGDFQADQPGVNTALSLMSCIVPRESTSQLVTSVTALCHNTVTGGFDHSQSCSLAEGECSPQLSGMIDENLRKILGRTPLSAFTGAKQLNHNN